MTDNAAPHTSAERAAYVEREIVEELAKCTRDPLRYVTFAFPWGVPGTDLEHFTGPRTWQRETLEEIGAELQKLPSADSANPGDVWEVIQKAVVSGHGPGKSALIGMLVMWALSTKRNTRGIITANTEKQLQTKTSPEIAKWHRMAINSHWFTYTTTSLYSSRAKYEKTWRFDLIPWSEHNTEAFAGLHNEGNRLVLLFDEASAIADKVWEVAEGALTDDRTEMLWLVFGNGTRATGRFRECFRKFRHRWAGKHIDSRTVEGTNKAQLDKMVADNGEDSDYVKIRVRGLFPAASPKQFISETDVDAAIVRYLREESFSFAPKIITLDPAWTGDDPLVIGLRQGLHFRILLVLPKNDDDAWVADKLMRLEDEHQADAVFIDAGYGTGIKSVGAMLGRNHWRLVWFGGEASDPGYANKRAEMWGGVKRWLKDGGSLHGTPPQLREDLIGPETKPRADGKILLESKEDMKLRGIPSPNYADALALSFAFPVVKRNRGELVGAGGNRGGMLSDYDPFA